ncbi:MAG: long-chain fatty acid--CoA ligase [Bacteriovoracaceae bacterium]|nr:long-chain fatty acid--CoA ligase [Bacteriovoracaceae bacterium]
MNKKNFGEFFRYQCKAQPQRNAIGWFNKGQEETQKFESYYHEIESIALGLSEIGLIKGSRFSILSDTSSDWNKLDVALLSIGCAVVPIYPTLTADDVSFILNHSETTHLFVDSKKQLEKIKKEIESLSIIKNIFVNFEVSSEDNIFFDKVEIRITTLKSLIDTGHKVSQSNLNKFNILITDVSPEDIATIIYTSGTTGEPKGAVMLHKTILQMCLNVQRGFSGSISERDKTLCFLPLSHVLGRCESFLNLVFGLQVTYSRGNEHLLEDISISKPSIVIAVPRVFEKIYTKMNSQIDQLSPLKKKLFEWAKAVSNKYFDKIESDLSPTTAEIVLRNTSYNSVYKNIYDKFGGNIRFFVSGGAPLNPEIIRFLRNANLTVLEGYGLTETFGPIVITPVRKQIPGSVGLPLGEVKVKIDTDGEILIKSESVFSEYLKNSEETENSFTKDGWFRTGDIGIINNEGYLQITDRKKDIIITSGGKNIAPQYIENVMKASPYISQFIVIGDQRNYLTAIVSVEKEDILELLDSFKIDRSSSIEEISKNQQIISAINEEILQKNEKLAKFETIKNFFIAPHNFTIDSGHLTPSMKIKRKRVLAEFKEEIDTMYNP